MLNYSFGAAPFEPISIQNDAPGVFVILNDGDDTSAPVSLVGNQINFYGTTHTSLFASSNGLLTFGSGNGSAQNSDLRFTPSQAAIAPLWSDWFKDSGNPMILGKIDANKLIIQWDNVQHFDSSAAVTFQVVIDLNTGNTPGSITFNYLSVSTGDVHSNGGTSPVGIKAAGTQGANRVLISFNTPNPLIGDAQSIKLSWADGNLAPLITSLSPSSAFEGSADMLLNVGGQNFLAGAVVLANGSALSTTFIAGNLLQATLPAAAMLSTGSIQITVQNPGTGGQISNPFVFTVLDAPLNAAGHSFSATEGATYTGTVASFTDLNPNSTASDFTATISWGDDEVTQGTVTSDGQGGFIVTGAHTYKFMGSYGFSVEINDMIGGANTTAFGDANILDAPITAQGVSIASTAGGGFLGTVAIFSDANPFGQLAHYTAIIHWGDGTTTPGRISAGANGGYVINGGHTYAKAGLYSHSVQITDLISGSAVTATGSASVRQREAQLDLNVRERNNDRKIALTINFSDLQPGFHRVRVEWGDGAKQGFKLGTKQDGTLTLKHNYGPWFAWKHRNSGADIRVSILNEDGSVAVKRSVRVDFSGFTMAWWNAWFACPNW